METVDPEDGFMIPPEAMAAVDAVRLAMGQEAAAHSDALQVDHGFPPELAGTIVVHAGIEAALVMTILVSEVRGTEPDRDRWMKVCGEIWDRTMSAIAQSENSVAGNA